VIDTMIADLNGPLFPNIGSGNQSAYNSVDAPLWFFWALQQYAEFTNTNPLIWKEYGRKMRMILEGYRAGTQFNIKMNENGLISAGEPGKALTWMDAVVNGIPVTPRRGYAVEINALWYNAVCFSVDMAKNENDKKFIKENEKLAELIKKSFIGLFWDEKLGYLADYVNDDEGKNYYVRPNMVIAVSLPYSMLDKEQMKKVLNVADKELVTTRGLRTLSPGNEFYHGTYKGNQEERDSAYHQGTVWPWLYGPFCEGWLKVYGQQGVQKVKKLIFGLEAVMSEHGISTISEIYDGDPPHSPQGAISQAWSVGEVLRIIALLESDYAIQ